MAALDDFWLDCSAIITELRDRQSKMKSGVQIKTHGSLRTASMISSLHSQTTPVKNDLQVEKTSRPLIVGHIESPVPMIGAEIRPMILAVRNKQTSVDHPEFST